MSPQFEALPGEALVALQALLTAVNSGIVVIAGPTPLPVSLNAATLAALEAITVQNPDGPGAAFVQERGYLAHYTTNGTLHTVKTGPGVLHAIWPGQAGTMKVYDSIGAATGILLDSSGADIPARQLIGPLDLAFTAGLTVQFQVNKEVTVIYR